MPRTRKSHPPSLEAKVAVKAIRGVRTAAEIANVFDVHPHLVASLKRQALKQLPAIFARTQATRQHSGPEEDAVYRQIGRQKVELDSLKKESTGRMEDKRRWVDPFHCELSIQRQCQLLGLARYSHCYHPRPESEETLALRRRLGELYMERPFFGSRRMAAMLGVKRKRVQRLMRLAGIEATYPKPRLSRPGAAQEIHPCLLREVAIERPNQVWASGITDVPMRRGLLYLVAVMDWFRRSVLRWQVSATRGTGFGQAALEAALRQGAPEMFNTDQGSQFTAADCFAALRQRQIRISMDGRGRWLDNAFIERLWRSVTYELIHPGDFADGRQLWLALENYFRFYNRSRPHQALGYRAPAEVFTSCSMQPVVAGDCGSAPSPGIQRFRPN